MLSGIFKNRISERQGKWDLSFEKKMGQLRTLMRSCKSTEVIDAFKDTYIS